MLGCEFFFIHHGLTRHYVAGCKEIIEVADPTLENPDNTKFLIVGDVRMVNGGILLKQFLDLNLIVGLKQKGWDGLPYTIDV